MSDTTEGFTPTPGSEEEKALNELKAEGHEVGSGAQPVDNDGNVVEKPIEKPEVIEKEPETVDKKPEEDAPEDKSKVDRTPTMVPAWKLQVAEDQAAKTIDELQNKLKEVSEQKGPITQGQQEDVSALLKEFAEESGMSEDAVKKFAEGLTKSLEGKFKPAEEITKTLESWKIDQALAKEEAEYSKEFDTDVAPLLKGYNLSDTQLSEIQSTLKDLAFSETYAKVPLKEIFKIKSESFDLKVPRHSAEGKPGVKVRATEGVVDLDNLSEEAFDKLTPEQALEFEKRKSGSWNRK